jgi:hypothetical protein
MCAPDNRLCTNGRALGRGPSSCYHPEAVANLISDKASSSRPTGSHQLGADIPDNTAAIGKP